MLKFEVPSRITKKVMEQSRKCRNIKHEKYSKNILPGFYQNAPEFSAHID